MNEEAWDTTELRVASLQKPTRTKITVATKKRIATSLLMKEGRASGVQLAGVQDVPEGVVFSVWIKEKAEVEGLRGHLIEIVDQHDHLSELRKEACARVHAFHAVQRSALSFVFDGQRFAATLEFQALLQSVTKFPALVPSAGGAYEITATNITPISDALCDVVCALGERCALTLNTIREATTAAEIESVITDITVVR